MDKYMKLYKQFWMDWKNYQGVTNLNDFWTTFVIHLIVQMLIGIIIGFIPVPILTYIVSIVLFVPFVAMGVRRLHDVGEKGTYMLWFLLPIVGWIFVILKWVKPTKVVA
ncbi:MAG TPA: hypothetical protein DCR44_07910 [Acholeplasmatales bacterium]|nr:MAG: hypothetical protein A2Y16_00155 [Tenericutes bacterium GWF2_57_13]HAQ57300.1 hypothetical protein [Acholeplasmatales bacterium]